LISIVGIGGLGFGGGVDCDAVDMDRNVERNYFISANETDMKYKEGQPENVVN